MKGEFMEFLQKYYKEFLLGIIIILIIGIYGLVIYLGFIKKESVNLNAMESDQELITSETEEKKEEQENMFVEIKGEVNKPGVYAITNSTIINDIVNLAGGFKKGAYTNNINLSKKVTNEMVIMVYSTYEYNKIKTPTIVYVEKECNCPSYDISSCINDGNSIIVPGENNSSNVSNNESNDSTSSNAVNINTASEKELMTLTGIGESKAKAIIAYREENGKFQQPSDLMKVSGISEKIYENLKDNITV